MTQPWGARSRSERGGVQTTNRSMTNNATAFYLGPQNDFRATSHPVPLPFRWREGGRRPGVGFPAFLPKIIHENPTTFHSHDVIAGGRTGRAVSSSAAGSSAMVLTRDAKGKAGAGG